MDKLKIAHLANKKLLNDKIGITASEIAKDKKISKNWPKIKKKLNFDQKQPLLAKPTTIFTSFISNFLSQAMLYFLVL